MNSLFNGFLEFKSKKELDELLINNLDKVTALKIIELSIETFQSQGAFTLDESFALNRCLSKLKENENNIETDNLRNDDNHGDSN